MKKFESPSNDDDRLIARRMVLLMGLLMVKQYKRNNTLQLTNTL